MTGFTEGLSFLSKKNKPSLQLKLHFFQKDGNVKINRRFWFDDTRAEEQEVEFTFGQSAKFPLMNGEDTVEGKFELITPLLIRVRHFRTIRMHLFLLITITINSLWSIINGLLNKLTHTEPYYG